MPTIRKPKATAMTTPAAAPQPAPQAQAAPTEMPATGGCWIRLPDGKLARDTDEHPEGAGDNAEE